MNRTVSPPVFRLITIAISHYCEKARWALEWLQIPYIEESHAPLFHRFATRQYKRSTVPILVTETAAFTDSTDILHYLDTITPKGQRLYPKDPELCREVEQLEELFDTQLGVYTRCWGYFYRLNDREVMRQLWCKGAPLSEQVGLTIAFPLTFPLIRRIIRQAYDVTAPSAASSLQGIEQIFETVNQRLADGRSYLVGDRFSAADLTFAALAAPALLPSEHPMKPPQSELKSEMADTIKKLRETTAGAYALRLYREQRHQN